MRTTNEKLRSLSSNSVWLFTKQETDFDESFKAACLFDGIPDRENTNIEAYFTANHSRYGIRTDRHRILVIPQLFGLITKTPFYAKGPRYNEERPTAVFDALKAAAQRGKEYNIIKTEQVLKLKIHAIIDTADNNMGHAVLPVIFIYRVLKELKEKYHISRVPIDLLYTYVMTCRDYSEAEDAVGYIRENAPASEYVGEFKSRSRVLTCIKKNISLFRIDSNYISIDPRFDAYFDKNFMQKFDVEGMHAQLARDVDYAYFLYDLQGFGVDLVGEAPPSLLSAQPLLPLTPTDTAETEEGEDTDDTDDPEYAEKVDGIRETNINEAAGDGAYAVAPAEAARTETGKGYRTNPLLGKIAIKKAGYRCEADGSHETFLSKKSGQKYTEAHHLVPACHQKEMWERYHVNIDCVENLVSLCPTCHKAIHYGTKEVQRAMIAGLYARRAPKFREIGLNISLDDLFRLYRV